ncbi:MAG: HAD-IB family phosphatase [Maricaulis sp.]|nr:HAD-IB family phosphatase [Maricaulis sp.]
MSRLIAFDVDSTLLRVESLDSAIEHALGQLDDGAQRLRQLHDITDAGMTGRMALGDSLQQRLKLAILDRSLVETIADTLRDRVTPGMKILLKALREQGDEVHAVSGGFEDLLHPVLTDLGFAAGNIHANQFTYLADRVDGLNLDYPLARNGGKAEILRSISGPYSTVIMVGDGMTDFEAFEGGAADRFIGFGGIAARGVVIAAAEHSGADYARSVGALTAALRK